MKFRNKETGEVLDDILEVTDRYCMNHNCLWQICPMEEAAEEESCGTWAKDHPHEAAHLMGYEMVENDELRTCFNCIGCEIEKDFDPQEECKNWVKRKETNMDKPRICEVLGVEVNQPWKFEDYDKLYRINKEGYREYYCLDSWAQCASEEQLVNIINHPERIICKPYFTRQDVEDAETVLRVFGRDGTIKRCNKVESGPYSNLTFNHFYINPDLFPSIKEGQEYSLDEIMRSEAQL